MFSVLIQGTRSLTFNMHQLLHLVQSVQNHGPLWTHSCFYFEDYNGQLRHFFHGTQNVEVQVSKQISVCIQVLLYHLLWFPVDSCACYYEKTSKVDGLLISNQI